MFSIELQSTCLSLEEPGHEQVVLRFAMSTSRPPATMQVSPGKGLGFLSKSSEFPFCVGM